MHSNLASELQSARLLRGCALLWNRPCAAQGCQATVKPSLRRQALCASMKSAQFSWPFCATHSSRLPLVSGHEQQIFLPEYLPSCLPLSSNLTGGSALLPAAPIAAGSAVAPRCPPL